MRKSTWRALLILALLVPLSRLSFADDTFAVSGIIQDSGDVEDVFMGGIPNLYVNGGTGPWGGGNQTTWGSMNAIWPLGFIGGADVDVNILGNFADWSFDGYTGSYSTGDFEGEAGGCVVEEDGCEGTSIASWTGKIDLYADGGPTIEILMSGGGTGSFGGTYFSGLGFDLTSGTIDATGAGEVLIDGVEQPIVPEPSTLTLMMIAAIASLLAVRFRRPKATQN
jgi:hypothetical protein